MAILTRILIGLVIAALALPIVICVLLAVGRLLAAMDDPAGATIMNRIALAAGVVWLIDLVSLLIVQGVNSLAGPDQRRDER